MIYSVIGMKSTRQFVDSNVRMMFCCCLMPVFGS